MASSGLMGTAVELGASVDALAALAAHVRLETEGIDADPAVRGLLAAIAAEVTAGAAADDPAAAPVVGLARAFLRQATELVEQPGRAGSWEQVDEDLLQGMGRLSMAVVDAFATAEDQLDGLGERMATDGARFLDVGTGTGWLAVAVARRHPGAHVVGLDIFEPALALARANVAAEGLEDRVELRQQDVAALADAASYDAVWLPLPFLPRAVTEPALAACARALRPGGWLLAGTFAGPPGRLAELLVDLRTVRAGGHPWRDDELLAVLAAAGYADIGEVPRQWTAPVRLFVGQRGTSP